MDDNYPKAYKEVIEILKYVPEESIEKIPSAMIGMFQSKMDKNHKFKVDVNKSFEEQNLLEETKSIFANIFRDYWATPYQRERIKEKEKSDRALSEKEKREKYNSNEIFKKTNIDNKLSDEEVNNTLPIEIEKETLYKKLIRFLKKMLHIE